MSVRERILTIRLMEKLRQEPERAKTLGLEITLAKGNSERGKHTYSHT